MLGVELCGALKNVVAIAAGAAEELGFGDNGKAGLMTRGLAEMTRLGHRAGANPLTFAGLAGIGDVIATCGVAAVAEPPARGRARARAEAGPRSRRRCPGVAEGAYTVDAALALADELGVEMPIAREVHRALFEGKSAKRCLIDLLARESKDELADYDRWAALSVQARAAGAAEAGRARRRFRRPTERPASRSSGFRGGDRRPNAQRSLQAATRRSARHAFKRRDRGCSD